MIRFQLYRHQLALAGTTILQDLDLAIAAGEKVALVGASGAGKTSLLGELYRQHPDDIALCPQQHGLVDTLSVYHNIYMGQLERHRALYNLWNLVRPIAVHRRAIGALADELGLADKLFRSVDSLSGGERQRVAIGRALYRRRPVFFGDEPVSSLDPLQGQLLLELILDRHATAVVALHNPRLALARFDRVVGLRAGRIVLDCPAAALDATDLADFYADSRATPGDPTVGACLAGEPEPASDHSPAGPAPTGHAR